MIRGGQMRTKLFVFLGLALVLVSIIGCLGLSDKHQFRPLDIVEATKELSEVDRTIEEGDRAVVIYLDNGGSIILVRFLDWQIDGVFDSSYWRYTGEQFDPYPYLPGRTVYATRGLVEEISREPSGVEELLGIKPGDPVRIIRRRGDILTVKFENGIEHDFGLLWFSWF